MNSGWTYRDRIDQTTRDCTVLDYYTRRYHHSNRAKWQQRIDTGQIRLNGAPTTADTRLQAGQWLTYHRPPWQEPDVPLDISILHADADVMIIAKPAGLPVLPGGGFLQHTVLWQLQQHYPDATPVPIHRLGRGTSGLLLLARSPQARARLSQQMRDRHMQKIYRTLAQGTVIPDQFTITTPIGKQPYPVLGSLYVAQPEGLPAHSECQVLRRDRTTTLLNVTILTGRPHQIRIHLASVGHPLVGDPLYIVGGVPQSSLFTASEKLPVPGDCGYHLHAMQLGFTHPNGQLLTFICPPPRELAD